LAQQPTPSTERFYGSITP